MVLKFAVSDAKFERSPGQDADIFAANMVDQTNGGPITVGFGRYGPNQTLREVLAVDDVMVILSGKLSVSGPEGTVTGAAGEVIYMPRGEEITIHSYDDGATTAYVTYPHWQEPGPA